MNGNITIDTPSDNQDQQSKDQLMHEQLQNEAEKENVDNNMMKEYLQTFERRSSDSKCVMKETGSMEKINLADEIKKLSDRLLMLSKINVNLGTNDSSSSIKEQQHNVNETLTQVETPIPQPIVNTSSQPIVETPTTETSQSVILPSESTIVDIIDTPQIVTVTNTTTTNIIPITLINTPSKIKPEIKKKPEHLRSKLNECFNRSVSVSSSSSDKTLSNSSLLTNGNTVINNSSSKTSTNSKSIINSVQTESSSTSSNINNRSSSSHRFSEAFDDNRFTNRAFQILKNLNSNTTADSISNSNSSTSKTSETLTSSRRSIFQSSRDSIFAQTFSANTPTSASIPSWQYQSRRTKFRINQASRDVPLASLKNHNINSSTYIIENSSATATKDCLLQLLEKYNENRDMKTSLSHIGRHQSISGEWGISDNLENRSMNSINAFFHRHATRGTAVKQIQAQIEARNK